MAPSRFNPSPDRAAKVLDDLSNPDLALRQVAAAHNTTLDALATWLIRDDTQARITALGTGIAAHARLLALTHIPTAVSAAITSMQASAALLKATPLPTAPASLSTPQRAATPAPQPATARLTPVIPSPDSTDEPPLNPAERHYFNQLEFRRRLCETSRRAAGLVCRFANFRFKLSEPTTNPTPRQQPAPRTPQPTTQVTVPSTSIHAPANSAHQSPSPIPASASSALPDLSDVSVHSTIIPDTLDLPISPIASSPQPLPFDHLPSGPLPSGHLPRPAARPRAPAALVAAAGR